MRPPLWFSPISLTEKEQKVIARIRRAKLFIFLREVRHELFDEEFQRELGTIFARQHGRKMSDSSSSTGLGHCLASLYGNFR